ncbi:MAG: GAF domain-containing protein, partial [Chloroflexota bacterium]
MTKKLWFSHKHFRVFLSALGILLSITFLFKFSFPTNLSLELIAASIAVIFIPLFYIRDSLQKYTLFHSAVLGIGILYGLNLAVWVALISTFLFINIHNFFQEKSSNSNPQYFLQALYDLGAGLLPLTTSIFVFNWQDGLAGKMDNMEVLLVDLLKFLLLYTFVHAIIFITAYKLKEKEVNKPGKLPAAFMISELLSLPFIIIAALAFDQIVGFSLLVVIIFPLVFSILINQASTARANLSRRVQDISILNEISQIFHNSRDLDNLLEEVKKQVTMLLGTQNFYVALYEESTTMITYPLAIKHGQHQNWPPRTLTNRLTDMVISKKQALLIPFDAHEEMESFGVLKGEEKMHAWLGVPLLTPERTLCCLAVMSFNQDVSFTPEDQDLLTILSGQVSVALENAHLYAQTNQALARRVEQLNILEEIGRNLSAAIHLEELFEIILGHALKYTQSPWGSMLIQNPLTNKYEIKAHHGYELKQASAPGMSASTAKA